MSPVSAAWRDVGQPNFTYLVWNKGSPSPVDPRDQRQVPAVRKIKLMYRAISLSFFLSFAAASISRALVEPVCASATTIKSIYRAVCLACRGCFTTVSTVRYSSYLLYRADALRVHSAYPGGYSAEEGGKSVGLREV